MGIFDGVMILSDLDGTLLNDAKLSEEHLKALRYFADNGGSFCPATGRNESFLFENFPLLPIKDYCIVKNGTALYDCNQKKYIWYQPAGAKAIDRALHLLDRFPKVERINIITIHQTTVYYPSEPDCKQRLKSIEGEVLKIVLIAEESICDDIQQYCSQFDDFQYVRSCPKLFEIFSHGADKGVCLQKLRSLMPQITHFVGIGDFYNDIALLKESDIGVAVESDCKTLQKYADWVAPPIEEHPIAWLVDKLENERLAGRI